MTKETAKECSTCKIIKELSEFYKRADRGKCTYRSQCKSCHKARSWAGRDKRKHRVISYKHQLKRNYNLSVDGFNQRFKKQAGKCLICESRLENIFLEVEGKRASVDHDHKTGEIRGLLCNSCNSGLGYLKDDLDLLMRAIDYLENPYETSF